MTKEIGDSTLSDTWASDGGIEEPDLSKKEAGWLGAERPAYQFMNFLFNDIQKKINHIMKNGVPLWNDTTTYAIGNIVANDGVLYIATVSSTNSEPPSANWESLIESFLPLNNYSAVTNPGVNDDSSDGYSIGSKWVNTALTPREAYMCLNASVGAAVWVTTTLDLEDLGSAATLDSVDEDNMASNSPILLPTQQSVKAYVDNLIAGITVDEFVQSGITIAAAGSGGGPYNHGLGVVPVVTAEAVCVTNEYGFVTGDVIELNLIDSSGAASGQGLAIKKSTTQVALKFGSAATPLIYINFSTGAVVTLTNANWTVTIRARRF